MAEMKQRMGDWLREHTKRRTPPDDEQVVRWLATVQETDPCLLALRELLGRHLLANMACAGDFTGEDRVKLRACERMEFARQFLADFERLREQARAANEVKT